MSAATASAGLVVVVGDEGAGAGDELTRTCAAALPLVSRMLMRTAGAVDGVAVRATGTLAGLDDEGTGTIGVTVFGVPEKCTLRAAGSTGAGAEAGLTDFSGCEAIASATCQAQRHGE